MRLILALVCVTLVSALNFPSSYSFGLIDEKSVPQISFAVNSELSLQTVNSDSFAVLVKNESKNYAITSPNVCNSFVVDGRDLFQADPIGWFARSSEPLNVKCVHQDKVGTIQEATGLMDSYQLCVSLDGTVPFFINMTGEVFTVTDFVPSAEKLNGFHLAQYCQEGPIMTVEVPYQYAWTEFTVYGNKVKSGLVTVNQNESASIDFSTNMASYLFPQNNSLYISNPDNCTRDTAGPWLEDDFIGFVLNILSSSSATLLGASEECSWEERKGKAYSLIMGFAGSYDMCIDEAGKPIYYVTGHSKTSNLVVYNWGKGAELQMPKNCWSL